jgi:hypothetical protein
VRQGTFTVRGELIIDGCVGDGLSAADDGGHCSSTVTRFGRRSDGAQRAGFKQGARRCLPLMTLGIEWLLWQGVGLYVVVASIECRRQQL